MRLFIAIELPDEVKAKLAGLIPKNSAIRRVAAEQLHLTLLFLGDVAAEQLPSLKAALASIRLESFLLEFDKTGCFPHLRSPRVFWAGLKPQPLLERLAADIRQVVTSCGIVTEEKPFKAHITLGRIKQPDSCDITSLVNRPLADIPSFTAEHFILFQSELSQSGAVHTALDCFDLTR